VEFAYLVAGQCQAAKGRSVLDLCAGCGVVGFDFHFYSEGIDKMDFVEVQQEYEGHFYKNLALVNPRQTRFEWHLLNYQKLLAPAWESKYDLVLCNPPYFEPDQGRLSPSGLKNRSRFYIDSDFTSLVEVFIHVVKTGGEAFFLMRPLSEHKKNLSRTLVDVVRGRAQIDVVTEIRGTQVVRLKM